MDKTKKLMMQIAGCLALGTVLGVAFWLLDGGRSSDCPGEVSNAQEIEFETIWKRDYRIRHIQDVLYGYERGIVSIPQQGVWKLKDELHRLLGDSKPIEIYTGKWHKDYLEVIK